MTRRVHPPPVAPDKPQGGPTPAAEIRFELLLVRPRRNTHRDRSIDLEKVTSYLGVGIHVGREQTDPAVNVWTDGHWVWTDEELRLVLEEKWVPTDPAFVDLVERAGKPSAVAPTIVDDIAALYPTAQPASRASDG